jgi:hypothetical protein
MIYVALASISIGAVLMLFAFFLPKENRALLIGEAMSKKRSFKDNRICSKDSRGK